MKFLQKFYRQQSEIIYTSYIKSYKLIEKYLEEVLYPKLNSENNNTNIKIVKNILIDGKELYNVYNEKYNSLRYMKEGRGILIAKNDSKYIGFFKTIKRILEEN